MPAFRRPFEFAGLKFGAKIHEIVAENSLFRIIRPTPFRLLGFTKKPSAWVMRRAELFHVKYIRRKAP
ncbi:hypothetical protein BBJ66_20825 [Rhizobium sp. RSm-3]|nr:hypothetical protein BBJ66_20825 [Rhizobium sp. RSm-3]